MFIHGCAHAGVGLKGGQPHPTKAAFELLDSNTEVLKGLFGLAAFWFGIMNGIPEIGHGSKVRQFALAIGITLFQSCLVPEVYGFTFVNAILYLLSGMCFLIGEKGRFYNLNALLIVLPNLPMVWLEAVACDSFLIKYGGHFWFDFMIPFSVLVYFYYIRADKSAWIKEKNL